MNQQDRHPLLDKMNNARRFRLSPEADERILDTLRQAEEAVSDGGVFGRARSPWAKWHNNWRPVAAACLAVVIAGGAVGVGYLNGGFHPEQIRNGPAASTKGAAASSASAIAEASGVTQGPGPTTGTLWTVTGNHPSMMPLTGVDPLVTSLFPQTKIDVLPSKKVYVSEVKSTNLPSNTPSAEAYLESKTVILSNGHTLSLSMNDLMWAISLGQHSLVAAVVPGTYPEEDLIGLLIKQNGQWNLQSDIEMVRTASYSQQKLKGLKLPANSLLESLPINFYDNKQGKAWMFYTADGMAVVAKYETKSFPPPSGGQHFMVRTYDAWMFSGLKGQESLAYMTDGSSTVAVGGDLTPAQSRALLASLPPLTNKHFPFS